MVDAIAVALPVLSLTHMGGGRDDIADIVEKLKSPPDAVPGEPPRFALCNLRLGGGQVSLTDQSVGKTRSITALKLSVPF